MNTIATTATTAAVNPAAVVKNDFEIEIVTGARNATYWTKRKQKWSEFVTRCSQTAYGVGKGKKGGFVGGSLSAPERKNANVTGRSLLTIDIDEGTPELFGQIKAKYHGAMVAYGTHSYTPEKPSFRVIVPFDRIVKPEEYEPVARKFAEQCIGMDYVDNCSYTLAQMFYWPTTPEGVKFFFEYQDGSRLDVDWTLDEYANYRNPDELPYKSGEDKKVRSEIRKQADPTEKDNPIGDFCRAHRIEDILDMHPDIYTPTRDPERYDYKDCKNPGVVCYDHKFVHSNHANSDPLYDKTLNAFDLFRELRFGELDKGSTETGVNLPSYQAMMKYVENDPDAQKEALERSQKSCDEDFGESEEKEEENDIPVAGEAKKDVLRAVEIDLSKDYPEPKYAIFRNGIGGMPIGDIQAIQGQAKSGKTHLVATFAAAILCGEYEDIKSNLQNAKVLFVDTEQHPRNTARITKKIHTMCGWDTSESNPRFRAIALRETPTKLRWPYIVSIIKVWRPDVVFIDGVRDLVNDFNDIAESSQTINSLMRAASECECAITSVLHTNPTKAGGGKMRGHLGTEATNKASDVWEIEKKAGMFTVNEICCRNAPMENFSFVLDEDGIPHETVKIPKAESRIFDEIKKFVQILSGGKKLSNADLKKEYAAISNCKDATADRHIKDALDSHIISKEDGKYGRYSLAEGNEYCASQNPDDDSNDKI